MTPSQAERVCDPTIEKNVQQGDRSIERVERFAADPLDSIVLPHHGGYEQFLSQSRGGGPELRCELCEKPTGTCFQEERTRLRSGLSDVRV